MTEKISIRLGKVIGTIVSPILLVLSVGGFTMAVAVLITGFKFLLSAIAL